MRTAIRELQYAVRRLAGSPGFTIAATLTLAIAIGATASVFGVVDGVLLKAFPFREPGRVLTVWESNVALNLPKFTVSPPDYVDFRAQSTAFAELASAEPWMVTAGGKSEPERILAAAVTPNYFAALGVTPLGRSLAQDSGGPSEVVVGYGYWQRRLGGATSAIGQTLILDDKPYTIVGVMPPGWPGRIQLWTRLSISDSDMVHRAWHYFSVFGRLKPGVTPALALQELQTIAGRLASTYPATNENWSVVTVPLLDQAVGEVRPALLMLLAAAGCVLLIGAANLANLFLVRCLAREREMAVRSALGATRRRLVRELLAEALTLGIGAGLLGVGVAFIGVRALRALAPPTLPRLSQIGVDGRVVLFCALASIATVCIFGLLPAWQASRGRLADVLKEGGRGTGSAQRHRLQSSLVVLQVAIALVLLTGAGLLVESFARFERTDPGFQPDQALTAQISLPPGRYPTPERQAAFAARVVERLATEPGVRAVSVSDALPGGDGSASASRLTVAVVGDPPPDPSHKPIVYGIAVGPEYFRTLGISVRRGRGVIASDDKRAVRVAIVDELATRRIFGTRDPVGMRITADVVPDTLTVVGVAAHVMQRGLSADDIPEVYVSYAQFPTTEIDLTVRTSGSPRATAGRLRRVVAELDPSVPISDVQALGDRLAQSVGTTRFSSVLASLFALVALVLGAIGIYSVLAYIVSQHRREIGIRIALGASHGRVMRDVLRRALVLTGLGIALGSGAAWLLTRTLAGLFVGVSPHDPGIFVGAAVVFAGVALVAASVPAFRTTRINPVVALTSI